MVIMNCCSCWLSACTCMVCMNKYFFSLSKSCMQRVGRLSYVGMTPTHAPISLNIQNCSKLPNAAVISLFRHITWSRSSSVPDNSLKVGKIIRYSDTRKTAKTPISPSSSSSLVDRPTTKLVEVLTFISAQNNCFLVCS